MAKTYHFPPNIRHRYHIKKPTGKRVKWGIFRRTEEGDKTVYPKALDAINEALKAGKMKPSKAESEVQKVVDSLYKADGVRITKAVSNTTNREILERFWEDEYEDRELQDPQSMYNDYRRAVDCLGNVGLVSADGKEMKKALKRFGLDKRRRTIHRLNTILKWLNRGFTIDLPKPKRKDVVFLTPDEFKLVEIHLEGPFRLLCRLAFDSGLRIGELFALTDFSLEGAYLKVTHQLRETGERDFTKTQIDRIAYLFPGSRGLVREFIKTKGDISRHLRHHASKYFKEACKKAGVKPVRFHDLRHSYAIRLLQCGATMEWTAKSLGNSITVCEKYYAGFKLPDAEKRLMAEHLDSVSADVEAEEKKV